MAETTLPMQSNPQYCGFSIGGVSLGIDATEEEIAPDPPLHLFRAQLPKYDIQLRLERKADIPELSGLELFDSGTTWRLYKHESGLRFDFEYANHGPQPYKRLLTDTNFQHACLQLRERFFLDFPIGPLGYPLDELLIMHRLTQERAIELHGTGIVRANGVANLFVGHSGAGKSTTTRLWAALEEVEVLSDDRIIVRRDKARPDEVERTDALVENEVLRSAQDDKLKVIDDKRKVTDDKRKVTDDKRKVIQDDRAYGMRMYGTPWHGEAMFASPNSAPLTRIFVLEHGHGNVITRLSKSQAVGELFARAFVPFHRHEYIDNALSFLEELVDSVPVYLYSFEPDERAVEKIQQFND